MKRTVKLLTILIMLTLLMPGLLYIGLAYYYRETYSYGTVINGIYATGKTPEDVNEELVRGEDYSTLYIGLGDELYDVKAEDIDYSIDYLNPLKQYKRMQNPYLWITNILNGMKSRTVRPDTEYDRDKLDDIIDRIGPDRIGEPFVCEIEYSEDGYILKDNKSMQYDREKCVDKVTQAIEEGQLYVMLGDECRKDISYTDEELKQREVYDRIRQYHDTTVTIDLEGMDIVLSNAELDSLLVRDADGLPGTDEEGALIITKESVADGLKDVIAPYNTYNNHFFKTHDGRTVHLTKRTLGNSVDTSGIADDVYEALVSGERNIRQSLTYSHKMNEKEQESADTIDNTYIEISLDEQRMYFYIDGELKVDINVVTGTHVTGQDTPEGVYYIYNMKRNTYLVGENYRCFVYTWMPIVRGVGIHDATWRKLWESDTYIKNGSHGCINTPLEEARYIYDHAYVGLPVIVYSYENSAIEQTT